MVEAVGHEPPAKLMGPKVTAILPLYEYVVHDEVASTKGDKLRNATWKAVTQCLC